MINICCDGNLIASHISNIVPKLVSTPATTCDTFCFVPVADKNKSRANCRPDSPMPHTVREHLTWEEHWIHRARKLRTQVGQEYGSDLKHNYEQYSTRQYLQGSPTAKACGSECSPRAYQGYSRVQSTSVSKRQAERFMQDHALVKGDLMQYTQAHESTIRKAMLQSETRSPRSTLNSFKSHSSGGSIDGEDVNDHAAGCKCESCMQRSLDRTALIASRRQAWEHRERTAALAAAADEQSLRELAASLSQQEIDDLRSEYLEADMQYGPYSPVGGLNDPSAPARKWVQHEQYTLHATPVPRRHNTTSPGYTSRATRQSSSPRPTTTSRRSTRSPARRLLYTPGDGADGYSSSSDGNSRAASEERRRQDRSIQRLRAHTEALLHRTAEPAAGHGSDDEAGQHELDGTKGRHTAAYGNGDHDVDADADVFDDLPLASSVDLVRAAARTERQRQARQLLDAKRHTEELMWILRQEAVKASRHRWVIVGCL